MNKMNDFFVVSTSTGAREGTYKTYKTLRGAENFAARLNAKTLGFIDYEAVSRTYYCEVLSQRTTTVNNLLSGKEVEIRMVDLGGPCDVSTERYFSM